MSGFRERIERYIRVEAQPPEKFGHQPRLYALTVQIGRGQTYDDDVAFAAAWLHDLGVFIGHRPDDPLALANWDNTAYAMAQAPKILGDLDFPAEKRGAVVEAIRTHQPESVPATIEGKILRDADILEQLGAIGIMRTVAKIGRDTRFPDLTSAATSLRKALKHLPSQIRLDTARVLAEPRVQFLTAFLSQVEAEAGSALH